MVHTHVTDWCCLGRSWIFCNAQYEFISSPVLIFYRHSHFKHLNSFLAPNPASTKPLVILQLSGCLTAALWPLPFYILLIVSLFLRYHDTSGQHGFLPVLCEIALVTYVLLSHQFDVFKYMTEAIVLHKRHPIPRAAKTQIPVSLDSLITVP